jgi:hypothetical protein
VGLGNKKRQWFCRHFFEIIQQIQLSLNAN